MSNELSSKSFLFKRRLASPPSATQNENANKFESLPGRRGSNAKLTGGLELGQEDDVFTKGGNFSTSNVVRIEIGIHSWYSSSSGETMVDDGDLEFLSNDKKHSPTQEIEHEFSASESRRRQRSINSKSPRAKPDSPLETTPTASPRIAKRVVSAPYATVKEETDELVKFKLEDRGVSSTSSSSNENSLDGCDRDEEHDNFVSTTRRPSDLPELLRSEMPPKTQTRTRRSFAAVLSPSKSPVTVQRASSLLSPRTRGPVSRLTRLRRRHSTVGSTPLRRVTSIPGCRGNLGNAVVAQSHHHQLHALDSPPHLNHRSSYHMPISPLATTSSHCFVGCKSPRHWTSGRITPNVFVSELPSSINHFNDAITAVWSMVKNMRY